ncbi:uncharacterized protein LOC142139984 [Mixophyes fleayi]|uniref:uncharacterized protein LOC142139984 n=1 Tax=Mixophyes fleayi TaxID=3061075 RepID=UPI003F4DDA3C
MRSLRVLCYWWQIILAGSIKVISVEKQEATVGDSVTLQCQLITTHTNIFQITWQKDSGNFTGPVATYSKKYGQKLIGYSSNRMQQFTVDSLNASAITINPVTLEDQGCFTCIFNVYLFGANVGRICLNVFEMRLSEPQLEINTIVLPEISDKLFVISCSATGQPAPNISWNLSDSLQSKPQTYRIWNPDHTVTVISNFTQRTSRTLGKAEVTCAVSHPALGSERRLHTVIQYNPEEEDTSAKRGFSRLLVLVPISACVILLPLFGLLFIKIKKMQKKFSVLCDPKHIFNTPRTVPTCETTCNNTGYTPCTTLYSDMQSNEPPVFLRDPHREVWASLPRSPLRYLQAECQIRKQKKCQNKPAMKPKVICTSTSPAILGGNVNLTCDFPYPLDVLQVTWEKKSGPLRQNMVTHSRRYGVHIADPFKRLVSVLQADTTRSSITITKLEKEDEACYICIFNTYPDGAFTGDVCLANLVPSNEVTCLGKGKLLNIIMTPADIMARQSAQSIKSNTEEPSVQKGIYIDGSIHPACTFQLLRARRKNRSLEENHKNSSEGWDDVIITQCSASGRQRPIITWNNEGNIISREYKENTTGNITTVTSTIHQLVSSSSTDFSITCNIKPEVPAHYVQYMGVRDSREEDEGLGDPDIAKHKLDKHQPSLIARFVIVGVVAVVILLGASSYTLHRLHIRFPSNKANKLSEDDTIKKLEEGTPGSNSENKFAESLQLLEQGHLWQAVKLLSTPSRSHIMRSPVSNSNKLSEDDSRVKVEEGTPCSNTNSNNRSNQHSSVKKRRASSTKKDNSKRRLFM